MLVLCTLCGARDNAVDDACAQNVMLARWEKNKRCAIMVLSESQSEVQFETKLRQVGTKLGPLEPSWTPIGAKWHQVGPSWDHVGTKLKPS